jgi:hypothetical protein
MAETFIPTIWSKYILDQLDKFLVAEQMTNRDWEGDIKQAGDRVKIWTPGDITLKTYTPDTDHAAPDTTTGTDQTLVIDQIKYFNFQIDKVKQAQIPIPMLTKYMERAIYAMKDAIDQYVLGLYVNVDAANKQTPTAALTASNVYTEFAALFRKMTDAKVPTQGRKITVSPRVIEVISTYFAARNTPFGDNVSINGYAGKFAGFDVYESHNAPVTAENIGGTASTEVVHNCLAGVPQGITLGKQIAEGTLEVFGPELRFAQACKGLLVYGAKMLDSGKRNGLLRAWWAS